MISMRADAMVGALAGGVLLALSPAVMAQTITEKAKSDETVKVERDNRLMEEAKAKGRATLAKFLALANAPKPSMQNFAVKVGLPTKHGFEYVWVRPFRNDGGRYSGRLRNTPQEVPGLKYGDLIAFEKKDIVDWMYIDGREMKGNFTACAVLKAGSRADREAFKKQYGLDCELQ